MDPATLPRSTVTYYTIIFNEVLHEEWNKHTPVPSPSNPGRAIGWFATAPIPEIRSAIDPDTKEAVETFARAIAANRPLGAKPDVKFTIEPAPEPDLVILHATGSITPPLTPEDIGFRVEPKS